MGRSAGSKLWRNTNGGFSPSCLYVQRSCSLTPPGLTPQPLLCLLHSGSHMTAHINITCVLWRHGKRGIFSVYVSGAYLIAPSVSCASLSLPGVSPLLIQYLCLCCSRKPLSACTPDKQGSELCLCLDADGKGPPPGPRNSRPVLFLEEKPHSETKT